MTAPIKWKASEELIHAAIIQFLRVRADPFTIWFHVPNGIPASPRIGARFVALGMRAGTPDICFTLPDGRSAFLEVKAEKGRQSVEQRAFQLQCELIGAPYEIVRSVTEAEAFLSQWGALRETRARAA